MLLGIAMGLAVPILAMCTGFMVRYIRVTRKYYELVWRQAPSVSAKKLLRLRATGGFGFHEYYYRRPEDETLLQMLLAGKHVLIVGPPGSGKTRALLEALHSLPRRYVVLMPRQGISVNPREFSVPWNWRKRAREIVILDDIDRYVTESGFQIALTHFIGRGAAVAATCRSGAAYQMLETELSRGFPGIFQAPVVFGGISHNEAACVASTMGLELPDEFNGTIGSILLPHAVQELLHRSLSSIEEEILGALRAIYLAWATGTGQTIPLEMVIMVARALSKTPRADNEWNEALRALRSSGIVEITDGSIRSEEVYLETAVNSEMSQAEAIEQLLEVFEDDPDTLSKIGAKALTSAESGADLHRLARVAAASYQQALRTCTLDQFPMDYATTQNNLGNAYQTLAAVRDKEENCTKAIQAYREALKVFKGDALLQLRELVVRNISALQQFCERQIVRAKRTASSAT